MERLSEIVPGVFAELLAEVLERYDPYSCFQSGGDVAAKGLQHFKVFDADDNSGLFSVASDDGCSARVIGPSDQIAQDVTGGVDRHGLHIGGVAF